MLCGRFEGYLCADEGVNGHGSILVLCPLPLLFQLLMDHLQGLKSHHGGDGGGDSADHVSPHAIVEGSPSFLVEYDGASPDDAAISGHVDHAVG
jgi:hypothetical protein